MGSSMLHVAQCEMVVAAAAILILFTIIVDGAPLDKNCTVSRCSKRGPSIRFPFWLKHNNTTGQPEEDHCSYPPGFQLSCRHGKTILEFQDLVNTSIKGLQVSLAYKAVVLSIDYTYKYILLEDTLISPVPVYSASVRSHIPQAQYNNYDYYNCYNYGEQFSHSHYTYFNCSSSSLAVTSMSPSDDEFWHISSLSTKGFQVYASPSYRNTIQMLHEIRSCTKMYNISFKQPSFIQQCVELRWSVPISGQKCEAKREYCKFDDDGDAASSNWNAASSNWNATSSNWIPTNFHRPGPPPEHSGDFKTKRPVAVVLPCVFLVVIGLVFLYYFIRLDKQRKVDELKIKMFMEDYKALKPTRYSYSDIKKMTNMFKHKLGKGGYGSVFKGQISTDIIVAVKVLHSDPKADGDDFINEVGTIGKIHHVNVVRLLGYCADGCNRALVYEFQPNHSLEKFVYRREKQQSFIGWKKMQKTALGIAKGIDYLHQGCAQQILHFDIKPNNILLDKNFIPKISDFGLAKLCNKGQSIVSMTMARGTIGYIAPEIFSRNFGNVSSKSEVYSFGMLLLEMVGGKTNNDAQEENTSEVYFPEWIFHRLEKGGEVAIQVDIEDDSKISRKLTIVGLWCIGWHPIDRPSMKLVVQMLEGDECPTMPPNPFSSATNSGNAKLEAISETE